MEYYRWSHLYQTFRLSKAKTISYLWSLDPVIQTKVAPFPIILDPHVLILCRYLQPSHNFMSHCKKSCRAQPALAPCPINNSFLPWMLKVPHEIEPLIIGEHCEQVTVLRARLTFCKLILAYQIFYRRFITFLKVPDDLESLAVNSKCFWQRNGRQLLSQSGNFYFLFEYFDWMYSVVCTVQCSLNQ